jgi:hypothetical protein
MKFVNVMSFEGSDRLMLFLETVDVYSENHTLNT